MRYTLKIEDDLFKKMGNLILYFRLTLPTPQQYRLESPLYFAAPKQQMMPDEKYPDPSQQQVASPVLVLTIEIVVLRRRRMYDKENVKKPCANY